MIDTLISACLFLGCALIALLMGAALLLTRIALALKLWRDPGLAYPLPRAWRAARRHTS